MKENVKTESCSIIKKFELNKRENIKERFMNLFRKKKDEKS